LSIGYQSPFVFISDAIWEIASALKAAGWPTSATGEEVTKRSLRAAGRDRKRALLHLEQIAITTKRNPVFEPAVEIARRVAEAAQLRLVRMEATRRIPSQFEPSRLGVFDEAWRQLCHACRDGAIRALSDEGELPAATFFYPGPLENFLQDDEIKSPLRHYHHVKFYANDIDRFLLRPLSANAICLFADWMLDYAKGQRKLGRKVKKRAAITECMAKTHAKWRQASQAYTQLPPEYRYSPRGRPKRGPDHC
jgi:hypothetical protein